MMIIQSRDEHYFEGHLKGVSGNGRENDQADRKIPILNHDAQSGRKFWINLKGIVGCSINRTLPLFIGVGRKGKCNPGSKLHPTKSLSILNTFYDTEHHMVHEGSNQRAN